MDLSSSRLEKITEVRPSTGGGHVRVYPDHLLVTPWVLMHASTLKVYVNLPICLFASIVLVISLWNVNLERGSNTSWRELATKFDFVGL